MIQKIVQITKDTPCDDSVKLSWFDMQKPHLSGVSDKGVEFIVKVAFTHLHEGECLISENGYAIEIKKSKDMLYELHFDDAMTFAKTAYEIGNRHQPIMLSEYTIQVLDDISLHDIITMCKNDASIEVNNIEGYFQPNGKAHHKH